MLANPDLCVWSHYQQWQQFRSLRYAVCRAASYMFVCVWREFLIIVSLDSIVKWSLETVMHLYCHILLTRNVLFCFSLFGIPTAGHNCKDSHQVPFLTKKRFKLRPPTWQMKALQIWLFKLCSGLGNGTDVLLLSIHVSALKSSDIQFWNVQKVILSFKITSGINFKLWQFNTKTITFRRMLKLI